MTRWLPIDALLLLGLLAGCATLRGGTVPPPDLSDDPAILTVEARAYLAAERWEEAAVRFEKLLAGLEHEPRERLALTAAVFLTRSRLGDPVPERAAARDLLRAWEAVPDAALDPDLDDVQRLVRRATLVGQAAAAEADPEFSAGPSNAIPVQGRNEEEFFLSRVRCGPDLASEWRLGDRVLVDLYREKYHRLSAACDGGDATREFWVDVSVWAALVAAAAEGADPPRGFTREEAQRLVAEELRLTPMSVSAGP